MSKDNEQLKDIIDDTLVELGFTHNPGNTKGRMYSSRFYHPDLRDWILELVAQERRLGAIEVLEQIVEGEISVNEELAELKGEQSE